MRINVKVIKNILREELRSNEPSSTLKLFIIVLARFGIIIIVKLGVSYYECIQVIDFDYPEHCSHCRHYNYSHHSFVE